ncbi:MAG: metallophosphoesterase [Clostridia bacterium]|nr:metallophosphoesterase [Clostridia bacterium]
MKYKKDNRAVITVFLITIIMALGIFGTFQAKDLQVTEYTIETPKELKQNYTVVLISDIHISYQVGYEELKKIIDLANAQNPDYIFIAGDFFDGDWRTFYEEDINSLLKEFSPRKETYMVLGNHDNFMDNTDIIPFLFGESGIKVLRDEKAVLNEDLLLVGRKDVTEGRERYGEDTRIHLDELFKDEDSELFSILMDHAPLEIYDAEKLGVNLQVSGHTHQGQIYPFGVITERYFPFDYGHLIRGDYHLIASSGVGTWGPPVRIGTKSEIVRINIKQKVR